MIRFELHENAAISQKYPDNYFSGLYPNTISVQKGISRWDLLSGKKLILSPEVFLSYLDSWVEVASGQFEIPVSLGQTLYGLGLIYLEMR